MQRSLTIIVPAFNEERRLPKTLGRIQAYLRDSEWEFAEILVVDDGSRDRTADIARSAGARVLQNPGNRGKGYAVRHGMRKANGDWVLLCDADLSSPIEELEKLWAAAEIERAAVVIGSRALDRSMIGIRQPFLRERSGRLFNFVTRQVTGLSFRDTQCGFKLFKRRAAIAIVSRQRLDGFGFDVELLYIAGQLGYKCIEAPVRWNDAVGTKVSVWRGLVAFLDPFRVRLNGLAGRYDTLQSDDSFVPVRSDADLSVAPTVDRSG
jgi:dolichyl-phosphate beta-glucosyltransferase